MHNGRRWARGLAVLTAGALAGTLLLTPATAHINNPPTIKHLAKHLDKRYARLNSGRVVTGTSAVNLVAATDLATTVANPVRVQAKSLLMAAADVHLRNTNAGPGPANQVECFLRLVNAAGVSTNLDTWVTTVAQGTNNDRRPVASLHGGMTVPRGTYNVVLRCAEAAGLPDVMADGANLLVWLA